MKKSRRRFLFIIIPLILIIGFIALLSRGGKSKDIDTVKVEKRVIVKKALAVGSIEPMKEIAVKSKISGVVGKLFADVGEFVHEGDILLEVRPNPTPLEIVQTKRNVEKQRIILETLRHQLKRNMELKEKKLISDHDFELLKRDYEEAELNYKQALEQLELIETGKVRIADKDIETVVKSPITGYVLEKSVNEGDPVVPLTSYQAGTELMRIADMRKLIFKGTVDEIDVGKIREGMRAELDIGALPDKKVTGHVSLISLKAKREGNRTVFPIEIIIDETMDAVLRAGFSANANIIIEKSDSVLSIPERVVTFRNDSAFVRVPVEGGEFDEKYIVTGISDAIYIEVVSGLKEGDVVLEKEVKEIK